MKKSFIMSLVVLLMGLGQVMVMGQEAKGPLPQETIEKAIKAYDEGKFEETYNLLTPLVKSSQANEVVYFYLGMVAYEAGNFDAAEKCYRKAISMNPNYAQPYSDLSSILLTQNKLEEAEMMAKTATKLDPTYAFGFANLGMIQLTRKKDEDASKSFSQAAKLDASIITSSGVEMLLKYNDPKAALFYLDISLDANPNQPIALLDAGQAHKMLGEIKEAIARLKQGYETTPMDQEPFGVLYSTYFRLLLDAGYYKTVIDEGLSKVGPDYPSGQLLRALAYYKMGKMKEFEETAEKYFSLTKEKKPSSYEKWAKDFLKGK